MQGDPAIALTAIFALLRQAVISFSKYRRT
jgi:hypothetical protein